MTKITASIDAWFVINKILTTKMKSNGNRLELPKMTGSFLVQIVENFVKQVLLGFISKWVNRKRKKSR